MLHRVRKLWPLWLVLGGLLVLVLVLLLPPLLIAPYGLKDPEKRLAAENTLRTTLAGTLGGLAVFFGAIVGALNFRETSRQNRAVLELQRQGQVTERYSKAIEQLGQPGPDKLDVRIGAVYALEQIAQDSPELHWPIMEVLTAYLREHARWSEEDDDNRIRDAYARTPADHQAVATVIGRRRDEQDPPDQQLDLQGVDLTHVRWNGAKLAGANLNKARLETAALAGAELVGALLGGTKLCGADLTDAHLEVAKLFYADLFAATLVRARLDGADFLEANLDRANLDGANLAWAKLSTAHGVTLAQLEGAQNVQQAEINGHLDRERVEQAVAKVMGPYPEVN